MDCRLRLQKFSTQQLRKTLKICLSLANNLPIWVVIILEGVRVLILSEMAFSYWFVGVFFCHKSLYNKISHLRLFVFVLHSKPPLTGCPSPTSAYHTYSDRDLCVPLTLSRVCRLWLCSRVKPSLGDRAGCHRYGFVHLMFRCLARKCFPFNELWPRKRGSFIDHLTFNTS